MIDQLDKDIHNLVGHAAVRAPDPVPWNDVLSRAVSPGTCTAVPTQRRYVGAFIAAAAVVVVLVGGIALANRPRGDDSVVSNSAPTTAERSSAALRPLEALSEGDIIVPTVMPDGWTLSPLVVHVPGLTMFDATDADGRTIGASTFFATDGSDSDVLADSVDRVTTLAGVEWAVRETDFVTTVGNTRIIVGSPNEIDPTFIESFVDGLRAGLRAEYPAGVFVVESDGIETAVSQSGTQLRVESIGAFTCHAVVDASGSSSGDCSIDPFDTTRSPTIALDNGIAVLSTSGEGRTQNAVDADAPVIETTLNAAGITTSNIDAVEITLVDGTVVTLPTQDLSGQFSHRYFVLTAVIAGDAFDGAGPIASIRIATNEPVVLPPPTIADDMEDPSAPVAIGGSVMLGAAQELTDAGFKVDALENRFFNDGVQVLERLAATGAVPDTVVISLADSGTIVEGDLIRLVQQVLRMSNRVVFVTSTLDREYSAGNNELIRALPLDYANVTVFDWATEIADCGGDCLYPDGMHLRPAGQTFFASKVTDAVLVPTPFEATGVKIGDPVDSETPPPGVSGDGPSRLEAVPEWTPVSRDGIVIGFARKPELHRVPPPPSPDASPVPEPIVIYDDDRAPIGAFGTDGRPHLDTD